MNKPLKILIVRLSAIGDVVHSLPLVHALKTKYPDCYIGWAVEDKAADLIINNPLVDKVHVLPKQRWKKRGFSLKNITEFLNYVNEIRNENYDISIDVQELFKSGLISYLSKAKRRIAHAGVREFADIFANEKLEKRDIFNPDRHVIDHYLDSVKYLGASVEDVKFSLPPSDESTKTYVDKLLKDLDSSKPLVVFSPATMWKSKHWVESHWSELLDMLAEETNVVFTGGKGDLPLIMRIINGSSSKKCSVPAGMTDIKQLIEVFRRTDVVVAPDSGPVHIAVATEKPAVVCIFGSTNSKRCGPYGDNHKSLEANISCHPCFERVCKKKENYMECVKEIKPQVIFEAVKEKFTHKENI